MDRNGSVADGLIFVNYFLGRAKWTSVVSCSLFVLQFGRMEIPILQASLFGKVVLNTWNFEEKQFWPKRQTKIPFKCFESSIEAKLKTFWKLIKWNNVNSNQAPCYLVFTIGPLKMDVMILLVNHLTYWAKIKSLNLCPN